MRKHSNLIIGLIMAGIGGFPFYMSFFVPGMAAMWLDTSTVVLFAIMGAAVAAQVSSKLAYKQHYEIDYSKGYILIFLDSTLPVLLGNGKATVSLSITGDKKLWAADHHLAGSDKATIGQGLGDTVYLLAGTFKITREPKKRAYRITWPANEDWRLL